MAAYVFPTYPGDSPPGMALSAGSSPLATPSALTNPVALDDVQMTSAYSARSASVPWSMGDAALLSKHSGRVLSRHCCQLQRYPEAQTT